jgi:hypothetical protein
MQVVCRDIGLHHYLVLYDRTPDPQGPLRAYADGGRGRERAKGNFERRELRRRAEEAGAGFVSCIKADRGQAEALAAERAFHVIRDPRDIVVSGYFSHLASHPTDGLPELAAHREHLQAVPKEEGLVLEMEFSRRSLLDMAEWDYGRPEILELKLEDLAARPYDGFVRIFQHLELLSDEEPSSGRELVTVSLRRLLNRLSSRRGLGSLRRPMPATGEIVLGATYGNRFEAKTRGRRAGAEDTSSHYRKGVAGDWINHLSPAVADAFEERFPGLVERLGYRTFETVEAVPI